MLLADNGRQTVLDPDVNFLVTQSLAAVTSGIIQMPSDTYFSMLIDPTGNAQPVLIQLQSAKLGNYVWLDQNANVIQDSGEFGVNNVVVQFYDGSGNLITSTTTGDDYSTVAIETGYYQFTGLSAGNYQVKFMTPADMVLTVQNANANTQDTVDSDANQITGFTSIFALAAGESNQTIDAGLVSQKASLGDRIWQDTNANGQQDSGETGTSGLVDTLLGGGDGLISTTGDNTTATTTTGAVGIYAFTGLTPGVESRPLS